MAPQVSSSPESLDRTLPFSNSQPARDLRSPVSYQVRQGSFIGWLRIFILLTLDLSTLFLAWRMAQVSGTDLSVSLHVHERVISFTPTAILTIGVFAVVGLYREGDAWRDFKKLVTTLLLVDSAIALTTLIADPTDAKFLIPFAQFAVLGLVFAVSGRLLIHLATQNARQMGVVRHPVFIFCHADQAKRIVPVLGRKHHYTVAGWNEPEQLDDEHRAATIQRMCRFGISEIFLCSQLPARGTDDDLLGSSQRGHYPPYLRLDGEQCLFLGFAGLANARTLYRNVCTPDDRWH